MGGGSTGKIFPGGGLSKFSAGGRGFPPSFPIGKLIYIYIYVYIYIYIIYIAPACVLIPLANHNSVIFSVP